MNRHHYHYRMAVRSTWKALKVDFVRRLVCEGWSSWKRKLACLLAAKVLLWLKKLDDMLLRVCSLNLSCHQLDRHYNVLKLKAACSLGTQIHCRRSHLDLECSIHWGRIALVWQSERLLTPKILCLFVHLI